MKFQAVIFSRANPNQKVEIVRLLKSQNIKTLAIGDGANDVNMIQEADVGVGILGKEGGQASGAADFSITDFSTLAPLLLRFGRLAYLNFSKYILYFFYKNFLMTMIQFLFGFFSSFTAVSFFDQGFTTNYNPLFTAFAIPALAVNDIDFDFK